MKTGKKGRQIIFINLSPFGLWVIPGCLAQRDILSIFSQETAGQQRKETI